MTQESISLNKYISQTGICSRREADSWIEAGRVKINSNIARKGNRVAPGDQVLVDDQLLGGLPEWDYIIINKPAGVTSTTDLKDADNIIDFINYPKRIFPIGRLDKASTGLLILTNDGDIVNKILREENNHEKEYIVRVDKPINSGFLQKMATGVPILGTVSKKCVIEKISKYTFKIILTQGLNRQIRRMCDYLGYRVFALKRTRIMHIRLRDLPMGEIRKLDTEELEMLFKTLNHDK